VPSDHFFHGMPPAALNTLDFAEITRFKTGRQGSGTVSTLSEALAVIAQASPATLPWDVNIEIKGVQGARQPAEAADFTRRLAEVVAGSAVPADRVLFSSFSLASILRMSEMLPTAHYGMLFGEKPDARPIYADRQEDFRYQYLPFDEAHAARVVDTWKNEARAEAKLRYLHPEFRSLSPDSIMIADKYDMGINSWALFEEMTPARRQAYDTLAHACQAEDVPFSIITDYIGAFR
jgi:glycerophosphoryl diester phosphodiesterase